MLDSRGVDGAFGEAEFREFVSTRSSALLRTAYLLAGDWASAEDLLQITLTKTFLAWKRLGHIESVEPYARRVLVNTATSWWRRRWHGERPTEVLPEGAQADGLEERLERDALWRHVRALPARQRAVLVLRFYEDQSEAETARLLDVSVGTVKSQCSRALASLRRRLGEEGIEPAAKPPPSSAQIRGATRPKRVASAKAGAKGESRQVQQKPIIEVDLAGHGEPPRPEPPANPNEPVEDSETDQAPVARGCGVLASAEQGQGT